MSTRADGPALPPERALVQHIRRRLPPSPPSLRIGPGDDAAVVEPERGALQVLTTDALIERVHFDLRWSSLADVGYKALAVNLSDLAAMGATPSVALLSLALPDRTSLADVDLLLDGFLELATSARVALAGGNLSRSPGPLVVDVTAVGYVRPRRILTRSGGRPGDALWVTGSVGGASAGVEYLQTSDGERSEVRLSSAALGPATPEGMRTARDMTGRHRRPEPRVRIGMLLGRNRAASACMDLSDGLADAVRQVAEASGTGALIEGAALPIDRAAREWFTARGVDPIRAALTGGDDFELLFAVPKKFRGRLRAVQNGARGVPLTRIGELTSDGRVLLRRDGGEEEIPRGYEHFGRHDPPEH